MNRHYGVFYPSYVPTLVKVYKPEGNPKDLLVDFVPINGITRYRIYGSLSPTVRTLIGEFEGNPPFRIKFPKSKIILPEELTVHIWVSYVQNNNEIFIQQEPATYYTKDDPQEEMFNTYFLRPNIEPFELPNPSAPDYVKATIPYEMMAFYRDEIRRRHVATLEIGAEEFILYKRRREGPVCQECLEPKLTGNVTKIGSSAIPFDPTVKNENDPRYQGRSRCEVCYGTGIIGGYYYPIRIKLSYWGMPNMKLNMSDKGLEIERSPNAWTLWTPPIMQQDILHRVVTGERFIVKEVKVSTWGGVVLRQSFVFESIPADDMRVRITKESITNALRKYNLLNTEEEIPLWI